MRRTIAMITFSLMSSVVLAQGLMREATTSGGERVLLHANGRWEFVDAAKQAEAKKTADQYPENRPRLPGAQGGLLGFGRQIQPGETDYNRGSLSGKGR